MTQRDTVYRSGRVVDVIRDTVSLPGGPTTRDWVRHPGAVGIIAVDDAERVLLVRQYRHPVGHLLWEPPAGLLDEPGEDPLDAARRELWEETHHEAATWNVLADAFTSPGMADEATRLYLARDVRESSGERHAGVDEERDMTSAWWPLAQVLDAIAAGALHNPLLLIGAPAAADVLAGRRQPRPGDAPWPQMSPWPGSRAAQG